MLNKAVLGRVPKIAVDILMNFIACGTPFRYRSWKRAPISKFHRAIESDPAHCARVKKFVPAAAEFPNAIVWLRPMYREPFQHSSQIGPKVVRYWVGTSIVQLYCVQQFAINIKLKLVRGTIADPYW